MTEFENWIVSQGLHGATLAELLDGVAIRLCSDGIPLARAYLALPTVNPNIRVLNHTWRPGVRTIVEGISHGQEQESFKVSPFNYMLQEGFSTYRWRLEGPDSDAFPVLTQMKAQGATDYLARLVSFRNTDAPALRGIAFSFTTDRKGGFADDEIARIDTVLPLTALAAYRIALLDLTIGVLDTYVGLSAGRRVLNGEIRRGSGEMLEAAILFADLRGFTALADRSPNEGDLIARLDEHLEAMAVPVTKRGGEVLKFMGDGLLAAFPKTDERSRQEACARRRCGGRGDLEQSRRQ
jgi:adenylate cyclase